MGGVWTPDGKIRLWSIDRGSAQILRSIALIKKPKNILELGTSAGYSTIWLGSAATEYGGKIFTVEMANPKIEMAKQSFSEAGLTGCITQVEGKISDVLDAWNKQLDMIFLDADKTNYLFYLKKFETYLLNDGAIIVADNAIDYADYMKDYTDYLYNNVHYTNQLIELGNGLLVSVYNK